MPNRTSLQGPVSARPRLCEAPSLQGPDDSSGAVDSSGPDDAAIAAYAGQGAEVPVPGVPAPDRPRQQQIECYRPDAAVLAA